MGLRIRSREMVARSDARDYIDQRHKYARKSQRREPSQRRGS